MAQTIGLVQRLKVTAPPILAWVYIGPTSNNTTFLFVNQPAGLPSEEVAYRATMVDALSTAAIVGHEVRATHASAGSEITMVEILA